MRKLAIDDILSIYREIEARGANVKSDNDEIELTFDNVGHKNEAQEFIKTFELQTDSFNQTSLTFKSKIGDLIFFDNLNTFLDTINLDISLLDANDIFIFDVDGHYFHYEYESGNVATDSNQPKIKFLVHHFRQYKLLLDTYLASEGLLYEIKRTSISGDEFVVISKGEQKLVTSIRYKIIDKAIFVDDNISLPISDFQTKILSNEWLACYNDTLCQFLDAQLEERRTFSNLFNNFNYIFNLSNKNFQLYILKFSFEKIRKQFKTEKNNYFDSLNTAQDKISSQIISVPISLGASIFSFYQFNSSQLILSLIYIGICIYSLFIGFVVVINLYDIKKIAKDVNEEKSNFEEHYPDLLLELERDFNYMKNKRTRVRILAWAIIIALIITLVSLAIFLLNYRQSKPSIFHFL